MLKKFYLLLTAAVFLGLLFPVYRLIVGFQDKSFSTVQVGDHQFKVEVADTTLKKQLGLSGRSRLADGEGMIFVFENPSAQTFWMKGMLIPIDIIWIGDGAVLGFEENVKPEGNETDSDLSIYRSPAPVSHVLEVKAGTISGLGIKVGDKVSVNLIK